jgi:hypothetical protein
LRIGNILERRSEKIFPIRKIHRAIFSRAGKSYPLFLSAALLTLLFSMSPEWHRGCYYRYQTKWRASGRFRKGSNGQRSIESASLHFEALSEPPPKSYLTNLVLRLKPSRAAIYLTKYTERSRRENPKRDE